MIVKSNNDVNWNVKSEPIQTWAKSNTHLERRDRLLQIPPQKKLYIWEPKQKFRSWLKKATKLFLASYDSQNDRQRFVYFTIVSNDKTKTLYYYQYKIHFDSHSNGAYR